MTYHIIRSDSESTAYCGAIDPHRTRYPDHVGNLCSKCSSKYYAERVKNDFPYHLSDRLDLSRDTRREFYKSIYEIRDSNETVIGFVATKFGWGQPWLVYPWHARVTIGQVERGEMPEPTMAVRSVMYVRRPEDMDKENFGVFSSKEHALYMVPTLVQQGKLPSRDAVMAQINTEVTAFRQSLDEQATRRELAANKRAEQMQLIQEEFAAMLADVALTNRQHAALVTAAELLGVKLAQP